MFVGPVNVELAGVAQSTWNFQDASVVVVLPSAMTVLAAPAGGAAPLSKSAPSSPPKLVEVVKHCCVAVVPASMAARSMAQSSAPRKLSAESNRLYVV